MSDLAAREEARAAYTPPARSAGAAGGAPGGSAPAPTGPTDDRPAEVRIVDNGPKVVSPAWELELLISGAVTFGLFQLPGAIRGAQDALLPGLATGGQMVVFMAALYARATVYALLTTFLLNLAARAYWVGLVGLQSVYPEGPRWEEYKSGPFLRELYQRRLSSLPRVIARVDDFASVLFSFGFLIAMVVVLSSLALAVLGGLAYGLSRAVPNAPRPAVLTNIFLAALFAPIAVTTAVDKVLGARLRPDGWAARALRHAVRYTYVTSGTALFGPVFIVLFTNLKRRRFYPLFYAAFMGAMGLAVVDFLSGLKAFDVGTAVYAPEDPDLRAVHAEHYESLRPPSAPDDVISVQSDVVDDPYLRLFIPYDGDRVNPVVSARCPDVRPQRAAGLHMVKLRPPADTAAAGRGADGALACLTRLYGVTLDGQPQPGLRFRFTTRAGSGVPGLLGYVPLAGVAAGEHVLRVNRFPKPGAPARPPLEIPFWR